MTKCIRSDIFRGDGSEEREEAAEIVLLAEFRVKRTGIKHGSVCESERTFLHAVDEYRVGIAASKAPESTLAGIFLYFMVTSFSAFYRKDG